MSRRIKRGKAIVSVVAGFSLMLAGWGCGIGSELSVTDAGGFVTGPANFGATPGGVQDVGAARELVQAGRVPPAEAFMVEGILSEHDLGLAGEGCQRVLCLQAALGIAPDTDDIPSDWLQVGMSSSIDPEAFVRPSLTLVAAVDVSGSMGSSYAAGANNERYTTPRDVARDLLSAVAAQLNQGDQIAIVAYGSTVETVLGLTSGDNQETIQAVVNSLGADGSTAMEQGLRRAYEIAATAAGSTDQVRVMLFSDLQPNVGATEPSEFEGIVRAGAEQQVGLTVMGLGVGLSQEFLNVMSKLRGGNAFSLFDDGDVVNLMDESWPWMVSPIAYDMKLEVTPAAGFRVADAYGFPGAEEDTTAPGLDVATVFLSKNKGALLVKLSQDQEGTIAGLGANVDLSYTTPEGEPIEEHLQAAYGGEALDQNRQFFQQPSVGATVALALLVSGMQEAAEQYETDAPGAIATLTAAVERFRADLESLDDQSLPAELELAEDVLELMSAGAEQGDLYGEIAG